LSKRKNTPLSSANSGSFNPKSSIHSVSTISSGSRISDLNPFSVRMCNKV
jgi:hypothetical protein